MVKLVKVVDLPLSWIQALVMHHLTQNSICMRICCLNDVHLFRTHDAPKMQKNWEEIIVSRHPMIRLPKHMATDFFALYISYIVPVCMNSIHFPKLQLAGH